SSKHDAEKCERHHALKTRLSEPSVKWDIPNAEHSMFLAGGSAQHPGNIEKRQCDDPQRNLGRTVVPRLGLADRLRRLSIET
ncbi:hypothetical protein AB9F41_35960, partial [Rhizobium leguminosarum]|uniref:hypothetical protein n=1 Tax=Rhizobium leguminosarum TaxID=384 RepID=UPI003F9CC969